MASFAFQIQDTGTTASGLASIIDPTPPDAKTIKSLPRQRPLKNDVQRRTIDSSPRSEEADRSRSTATDFGFSDST